MPKIQKTTEDLGKENKSNIEVSQEKSSSKDLADYSEENNSSWDEQVAQENKELEETPNTLKNNEQNENKKNASKEENLYLENNNNNTKQNNNNTESRKKQDIETTTRKNQTKEQNNLSLEENLDASSSRSSEAPPRMWSSLFPKLKRGQSTYSSFSPRNTIRSKNENALIIDIQSLKSSFNEIMTSLFESVKFDITAAKQHFTKGVRTHLEIIFTDKEKLGYYATKGINILNRTYYGYIPVDMRKSFLPVKVRNVPLGNKEALSDTIKDAFEDIGKIASIKPLLIEGTPYLTDQWIIIFETTEDPCLEDKIPRFTHI
jgi:hypothetical protein